jgi:acyl-CoA synthetase (AMP-forming)/AMP-acid ligase II
MTERKNLGDLADRGRDLERLALIDLGGTGGPREYTHGDIDRLAGGVAHFLRDRGLPRGARVAIASLNRAEYVAAYFGIMRAGYVAVPINTKLAQETIDYILTDAGIVFAFVDRPRRALIRAGVETVDFDDAGPQGFAARIAPADFATVIPEEGELAQVLYTSGSTGRPKGVPLSHAGQLWALHARASLPAAEQERHIVAQPLFHMNGLMLVKGVFLHGASVVMLPSFDTLAYTEALSRYRVTNVLAIPTMFARVLKELDGRPGLDLSSLKRISLASAPVTLSLIERVRNAIPSAEVSIGYGTTEAGPSVFGPHPQGLPPPPLALGYPLASAKVKLVDGINENEGVLMMRNRAVAGSYLNLPEQSKRAFSDGWYYSGDVMRRDRDGFYYFVGRADDMFVCSGENIYPGEVEKLLEQHPKIRHAAVVPLPDEERGQVPVAFVVRAGDEAALTSDEIKNFAIQRGPAYQHPRRVKFLDELPWAGTNKIDRAALLRSAREIEASAAWSR